MQRNPILEVMGQTRDMRRDYYKDLHLRVENRPKGRENIRHLRFAKSYTHIDVGDDDIVAAVEAAARITTLHR